jgi:hypothetical protein
MESCLQLHSNEHKDPAEKNLPPYIPSGHTPISHFQQKIPESTDCEKMIAGSGSEEKVKANCLEVQHLHHIVQCKHQATSKYFLSFSFCLH